MGENWVNNFLKIASCFGFVICFKVFHFNWNFWKFNIFQLLNFIWIITSINSIETLKFSRQFIHPGWDWLNFSEQVTSFQYMHLCIYTWNHIFTWIIAFFILFCSSCVTHCQCYYVTFPVIFTKNSKLWNEKKEDLLYLRLLSV